MRGGSNSSETTLVWLLAGYGFLASVLPGWMLLVPRGYLSTFMKLGVVVLLGVGVVLMAPTIEMPRVTVFASGGGPIIPGTLFPVSLYYHCLRSGLRLSFAGLVGDDAEDDRAGVTSGGGVCGDALGKFRRCHGIDRGLGVDARRLSGDQYDALARCADHDGLSCRRGLQSCRNWLRWMWQGGPAELCLSRLAWRRFSQRCPAWPDLMAYWYQFALVFEALFILTTIDTGTRVARYLIQEMGGRVYPPFRRMNWRPGVR